MREAEVPQGLMPLLITQGGWARPTGPRAASRPSRRPCVPLRSSTVILTRAAGDLGRDLRAEFERHPGLDRQEIQRDRDGSDVGRLGHLGLLGFTERRRVEVRNAIRSARSRGFRSFSIPRASATGPRRPSPRSGSGAARLPCRPGGGGSRRWPTRGDQAVQDPAVDRGDREVGILRLERAVGVEDRDQERLGRLVVQGGEVRADLDSLRCQSDGTSAHTFLKTAAPAIRFP